jgi:hypothetical protein
MTVAELIEMLKAVPQDSMVVIPGYEGGFDNPSVHTDTLVVDTNWDGNNKTTWYYGRHDRYYKGIEAEDVQPMNCVVVGRGK